MSVFLPPDNNNRSLVRSFPHQDAPNHRQQQKKKMLARQSARLVRASVQARQVSSLVNKPSHVVSDQKLFTTSHKHTYVKRNNDKYIYGGLMGLTAIGFLQFFRGELHMANGTHKKD